MNGLEDEPVTSFLTAEIFSEATHFDPTNAWMDISYCCRGSTPLSFVTHVFPRVWESARWTITEGRRMGRAIDEKGNVSWVDNEKRGKRCRKRCR
jgi:hypothetical protein